MPAEKPRLPGSIIGRLDCRPWVVSGVCASLLDWYPQLLQSNMQQHLCHNSISHRRLPGDSACCQACWLAELTGQVMA